jgi:hypothetical protein
MDRRQKKIRKTRKRNIKEIVKNVVGFLMFDGGGFDFFSLETQLYFVLVVIEFGCSGSSFFAGDWIPSWVCSNPF